VSLGPPFAELLEGHAAGDGLARLVRYCELLERWSQTHNLVRYRDRGELVERHIEDALAAREVLGRRGVLLDVGSGAGLPGVPLLAVLSGWRGVLLEPRQKRWTFLRLVVRELGLDAEVVAARYQEYGDAGTGFDAILARAVGGYPELVRWSRDRLAGNGRILFWTGAAEEIRLRALPGWRVLSSPLPHQVRGRLLQLIPCFT
jgi:16S rRNA (guanine527-N7)-methyltransferase